MISKEKYKEYLDVLIYFCDYRDRCKSEVYNKMKGFEISEDDKNRLLKELEELNILNEKRYVEAYIGGKTRIKRWGKNKIQAALRAKKIDESLLQQSLNECIDLDRYREQIDHLFTRKWEQLKRKKDYSSRQKIYRYLYSKGYESEYINECFKKYVDA